MPLTVMWTVILSLVKIVGQIEVTTHTHRNIDHAFTEYHEDMVIVFIVRK